MNIPCEEINEYITQSMQKIDSFKGRSCEDRVTCIFKLWMKLISNSETIISLVQVEKFEEAVTIYRLSLEHLFNIFALVEKPSYFSEFKDAAEASWVKSANKIQSNIQQGVFEDVTEENVNKLNATIDECEFISSVSYSIYNASKISKATDFMYDSQYRLLSMSHAHSTYLGLYDSIEIQYIENLFKNVKENLQYVLLLVKEKDIFMKQ